MSALWQMDVVGGVFLVDGTEGSRSTLVAWVPAACRGGGHPCGPLSGASSDCTAQATGG